MAAVQCLVILGLALNMHSTLRRCSTSSSSPFTLRDGACVILLCGSFIRCVWLLDPEGTHGLLSPNVALFLLRLPQLLWVSAISVLILTWSYVMSAVCEEQSRHKYSRWTLVAGLVSE